MWLLKFCSWFNLCSQGDSLLSGTFSQSWVYLGAQPQLTFSHLSTRTSQKHLSNGCLLHSRHSMWSPNLSRSPQVEVKPGATLTKLAHVLLALAPLQWAPEKSSQFCRGVPYVFRNTSHSPHDGVC